MADETEAATGRADGSNKPDTNGNAAGTPQGVPAVSVPTPAAPTPAPNPAAAAPQEQNLGNDIAKILQEVKLPERHGPEPKKQIENKAATFDTNLGAQQQTPGTQPEEKAVPSAAEPQTPQQVSGLPAQAGTIPNVHTLKDDLQHVVRDQKISVVKAVALEEDRRGREKSAAVESVAPIKRSGRVFGVVFTVLLLVVLGGAALFGVYTVMQSRGTPAAAPSQSSILFAEASVAFPLDNQGPGDLKRTLAGARGSGQGALGAITEIVPTLTAVNADGTSATRAATFAEFMSAIGAHPPDELLRALSSDFFFGIHTVDKQAPLFVIPVTSYDHAFAGMLAWEHTLNSDLTPIFIAVPSLTKDSSGLPIDRTFQDLVMRNYDVRALEDDAGQIQLYYSFPTQSILVIAESPYSFPEILSRLQAQREL